MSVRAGFGTGIVTPPVPAFLAGFGGRTGPTESVHDELEARAVVLADEQTTLCLIVCDLLGMTPDFSGPVRDAVAQALGVEREAVLTACTHTHSGPSALAGSEGLGWKIPEGYRDVLVRGCTNAARAASAALETGTLRFGRFEQPAHLSINRRGNPYDPWFTVLDARRADGSRIGVVAGLAIHPVSLGPMWMQVSADWPRACREALEEAGSGTAIVLSGALGDVNPPNTDGYDVAGGSYERTAALGRDIAAAVAARLDDTKAIDGGLRVVSSRSFDAPVGETGLAVLNHRRPVHVELVEWEVCGVRLVAVPGEAFQAFGRAVEDARAQPTILAGICPSWQGYLPHPFAEGYEEGVSFGEPAVTAILDALVQRV